jgi:hypothetical protein
MLSDEDTTYIFIEICQQRTTEIHSVNYTIGLVEIYKLKKILEQIHYALKPIIVFSVKATISIFSSKL